MVVFCTYCSAKKDKTPGLLPAIKRYQSARIRSVSQAAAVLDVHFSILSGEYGLVSREQEIPWYDHLLHQSEIDHLASVVAGQLQMLGANQVVYFVSRRAVDDPAFAPYIAVPVKAAQHFGISFCIVELPEAHEASHQTGLTL